jgi:hypothetical protein
MFRALGARLNLDWKGVTGAGLFEAAAQRSWLWATDGLKTAPISLLEGELQEGGLRISALRSVAGSRALCHVTVHRPDAWDPATLWLTTVDLVRTGDIVEIGITVEQDMRHHRVPPSPLSPPLVDLLHDLVARGATAGSQRARETAEPIAGSDEIEWLVHSCLLDPARRLPVVLFSAIKEEEGVYPTDAGDPALTARELCGLAHVFTMPRVEDSHRLTKRLRMLSVYDGAVRIYWPRFRLTDPPPRHPLHLRQRLNTASGPAIIRRVVEAGARSYHPPDGTATLLAARWRDNEHSRIESMSSDPDPARQAALLRAELLRVVDANVSLELEMDSLRHQLMRATERSDRVEAELAGLRPAGDAATELTGRPSSSERAETTRGTAASST